MPCKTAETIIAADSMNTTSTIACFCHNDDKAGSHFFFICRSCFAMDVVAQRVSSKENENIDTYIDKNIIFLRK